MIAIFETCQTKAIAKQNPGLDMSVRKSTIPCTCKAHRNLPSNSIIIHMYINRKIKSLESGGGKNYFWKTIWKGGLSEREGRLLFIGRTQELKNGAK